MKKIIYIFLLMVISCVYASEKNYSTHFNGTKYNLLYSVKNPDFGGYLNEYYRNGETYNIWSDMVAIHHFPNAYSPINRIRDFKDYLSAMNIPSSLTFNDKKNAAMIDFVAITSNQMPVVLEFNIFKYEKSKKCGSVAVQYVKRYSATTTMQIEAIKSEFEKNRKHLIKKVKNYKIPEIITENVDKCISGQEVNKSETVAGAKDINIENDSLSKEILENNSGELVKENSSTSEIEHNSNLNQNINEENEKNSDVNTKAVEETGNTETIEEIVSESTSESSSSISKEDSDISGTNAKQDQEQNLTKASEKNVEKSAESESATEQNSSISENEKNEVEEDNTGIVVLSDNKAYKYEIKNTKDKYIAHKRTNKELRKQTKLLKKQKKLESAIKKKEEKRLKKEALKQKKENNKVIEIKNSNNLLIAKPRTKKEMREHVKQLKSKRLIKQRAKQAKKKLSDI